MRGQSVSVGGAGRCDRSCHFGLQDDGPWVAVIFGGSVDGGEAATDEELVPVGAVLIEEEDRRSEKSTRAVERDAWISSMRATRPWTSGSWGTRSGENAS